MGVGEDLRIHKPGSALTGCLGFEFTTRQKLWEPHHPPHHTHTPPPHPAQVEKNISVDGMVLSWESGTNEHFPPELHAFNP